LQEGVEKDDGFVSTVQIERIGSMDMPVPVKAVFEDGTEQTGFTLRGLETSTLRFESNARLADVVLDPDGRLAMLDSTRPATTLDLVNRVSDLPWSGAGEKALEIYPELKEVELKRAYSLFKLGLVLCEGGYYPESLETLKKASGVVRRTSMKFATLVWIGHLQDLLGNREEALEFYNRALEFENNRGLWMVHDQYDIRIDRKWVEDRLKTPFTLESK
jgi:tetratricopeptide (TPR) repeat protein